MNPLLKHTLEELNKPNADPVWIIGEAFTSLLKQANENSRLNLCGGDAVDENTAKYIQSHSIFDDYVSLYAKDKMPKLCTHIPHNFFTGWTNIFYRKPKQVTEIPDGLFEFKPNIPQIHTVSTCNIPSGVLGDRFYSIENVLSLPEGLFDDIPDIPPISNVMTCRNRLLQGKRLPNCAEICSRGFYKVPKLKRECEIPDCWL